MDLTLLTVLSVAVLGLILLRPLGALVVLPEGQQRSGSIGGATWSHNRSGVYIRSRSIPVNPNTARQVAVRNAVRSLAIAWENELNIFQRNGWNIYAGNVTWKNKLGQDINLTGLNHYIRSNTQMVTLGFARQDQAPAIMDIAAAELALGCSGSEATQQLDITFDDGLAWATEAGAFQHFFVGRPQNNSRQFFGGPYKYVTSVAGVTPAVSPKLATSPWAIQEGQRVWVRSRTMRADGRLSEFAQAEFLCAA